MVQLTQSCSNTHTRQGSLCAYRLFLEYIKISDGDSLNFISMSSILLIFPASLELSSAHFTLIHGGFPCITRHMFVTLLHNPPPLHSYLPHLHTVPLYSWATACCIKLSPSPPLLLHPSFQQPPVTFQAGLSDSLGNSSSCLALAYIFHAVTELPPL